MLFVPIRDFVLSEVLEHLSLSILHVQMRSTDLFAFISVESFHFGNLRDFIHLSTNKDYQKMHTVELTRVEDGWTSAGRKIFANLEMFANQIKRCCGNKNGKRQRSLYSQPVWRYRSP